MAAVIVRRAGRVLLPVIAACGAVIVYAAPPYLRAASFIARVTHTTGWTEHVGGLSTTPFAVQAVDVPTRAGPVRGRLYASDRSAGPPGVLVSGVHPAGIDEPRLVDLAKQLAASGMTVLTPELPDLTEYRVTPRATDIIEDAALWLSASPETSPDGAVGLLGISFSGGLSVVAAGRPSVRSRTAFVFSLGGHGDLGRVLRYLCTGATPTGGYRAPHDYGVAIVLASLAQRVVPADQVEPLQDGIRTFLSASILDYAGDPAAAAEYERARAIERALAEPAAGLLRLVNTRDVDALGPKLLPHVENIESHPALSPERTEPPSAPVYLLHGLDDNVIPAVESSLLAQHLAAAKVPVRLLLSELITHAEVNRPPSVGEVSRLVGFWKDLFQE